MATLKKINTFVLELTDDEASALFLSINCSPLQGLTETQVALARETEELLADRNES